MNRPWHPEGVFRTWAHVLIVIEPIPAVLKRLEDLSSNSHISEVVSLLEELSALQDSVAEWCPREDQFEMIEASDDGHLNQEIEEHAFIMSNGAVSTFFRFEEPTAAREIILCWSICLIIECAVIRLCSMRPGLQTPKVRGQANRAAVGIARAICRTVWYMSQMPSLAYAKFMKVYIRMAETVFEEAGALTEEEKDWTRECLQATGIRMARLMSMNKRTLCCVDEIGPGFTRACRWRSYGLSTETSP